MTGSDIASFQLELVCVCVISNTFIQPHLTRVGCPKAPRIKTLFEKEEATPARLTFLWETEVGEMVSLAALGGRRGAEEDPVGAEGEEGGRPQIRMYFF